jgi:autoinducer 2-degrading protein
VLQSPDNPSHFVLYEAYASGNDAAAHKQTAHYLAWRDAVADWMEVPRKGVPYTGLFPAG